MWSRETPRTEEFLMSQKSDPPLCQLYLPGHNVHWIHARKVAGLTRFRVSNLVIDVESRFVSFIARGETHSFWTHNHLWIDALREHYGYEGVYWCPAPNTLCVELEPATKEHGRTSALFYLADEPSECTEETIPGHPIREIRVRDDDSHRVD